MERRMEGSIERIINLRVRAQRVGRAQGVQYPKKCMRVAACVGVRVRWGIGGVVCLAWGGRGGGGGMELTRVFSNFLLIPPNNKQRIAHGTQKTVTTFPGKTVTKHDSPQKIRRQIPINSLNT